MRERARAKKRERERKREPEGKKLLMGSQIILANLTGEGNGLPQEPYLQHPLHCR